MRTFSILVGTLSLLLSACGGRTPPPVAGVAPPTQVTLLGPAGTGAATETATALAAGVLIEPADVLSVTVYREPDLSLANVPVAPDGTVQVPLLGNVAVQGLTPDQVSRQLTTALGRYLVRPEVAVNVVSSPTRTVTVEGAVVQPGVYPFLPRLTLVSALAQSRGLTRVARSNQVVVFRTNADGRYLALFDIDAIRAGRAPDLALQPGDTVVVGASGRRQLWQDFLQAAPLIGIFARI